jgi:hypothetical protein
MGVDVNVREIAKRFHVHYEVYPEMLVLPNHNTRQIGFCLELYGEVGVPVGNDRCTEARRSLKLVSSSVLAAAKEDCRLELIDSPGALYYCSSQRGLWPCVRLVISILHRDNYERPLDGDQRRALESIENGLRLLGAPKGRAA